MGNGKVGEYFQVSVQIRAGFWCDRDEQNLIGAGFRIFVVRKNFMRQCLPNTNPS